ncbi:hypothetical protein [Parapedobacter sp. 2B3]|uniref:hypothetical protein n=1 Tax=Parapedobacter sp. 2B3 TaxID=3342381 RepID=UPI0035B63888
MRITEFAYGIIERFAPMSEKSAVELKSDAMGWYNQTELELKSIDDIKKANALLQSRIDATDDEEQKEDLATQFQKVPKESLAHKVVRLGENWVSRTLLAILFIYITPKIQEYLNPTSRPDADADDEDYED